MDGILINSEVNIKVICAVFKDRGVLLKEDLYNVNCSRRTETNLSQVIRHRV